MLSQKAVKRVAAVIAAVLVGSMLFSMLAGGIVTAGAATTSELKQQLNQINSQQKKIKEEIAELNKQFEAVSEKKAKLEEQMVLTEDEITAVQGIIEELEGKEGTLHLENYAEGRETITFDIGEKTEEN